MIKRRAMMLGGIALGCAAAGGGASVFGGPLIQRMQLRRLLRAAAGPKLASTAAADEFIRAIMTDGLPEGIGTQVGHIRYLFFTSTTAMAAHETGEEPEFLGLFDQTRGCLNGLSAGFAPDQTA